MKEDFELKGDLEIRGNVQPVTLKVSYGGKVVDGYGQEKMGFEVTETFHFDMWDLDCYWYELKS